MLEGRGADALPGEMPAAAVPWRDVRAVLFDLDGTLVETPIDFGEMRRASLAAAARHGAAVEDLAGLDVLAMVAAAGERVREVDPFQEEIEAILQAVELRACMEARAMPGARAVLEWLEAAGMRTGIVTRNCPAAAVEALRRAGIPYDLLLTRADVPRVKPDPVHLLLAAERLGAAPEATVMVGDHVMDVRGGRAAGMRTVGFAPLEERAALLAEAGADRVIRELEELKAWISPPSW